MLSSTNETARSDIKPVVKWAGGKRQLLPELSKRVPEKYGRYLEPFFGGGALFFQQRPNNAVLNDANAELINLYSVIADDLPLLVAALQTHINDVDHYYKVRSLNWALMDRVEAAARTLFLNRTCFNGLYRVNKRGEFNVPFGHYKKPNFCDEVTLQSAQVLLQSATLLSDDYKTVLDHYATAGDFVFLDPPYYPVSTFSDFKRYTKEQFHEQDHVDLANEVDRLADKGCHVLLTNSNCEFVRDLYRKYPLDVVDSKRNISSKGNKRSGKDVIVTIKPKRLHAIASIEQARSSDEQLALYPPTRFMGSKRKLLPEIATAVDKLGGDSVLDLFSGSGVVSYMLKARGKRVISNDHMAFCEQMSLAMIENNSVTLPEQLARDLMSSQAHTSTFVQDNFNGLYFTDTENALIDTIRSNVYRIDSPYLRAIGLSALIRACFKKRPRGIFTYVGHRYDDGRKDLTLSLKDHFLQAVEMINAAVFSNGHQHLATRHDALTAEHSADIVYLDPPYFSTQSDNAYVRRYHFVEGIACNWEGVDMQWHTKTKKFKNYPTPFSKKDTTYDAFKQLFAQHAGSKLLVSYSSNSMPSLDEMLDLLREHKDQVEVVSLDHQYSFGNQGRSVDNNKNRATEYLFLAR